MYSSLLLLSTLLWVASAGVICPDELKTVCTTCLNGYSLDINFKQATYDWRLAINTCNAEFTESLSYDISHPGTAKNKLSRTMSLDFASSIDSVTISSPDATINGYTVTVIDGTIDADGNRQNYTARVDWVFSVFASTSLKLVRFTIKWTSAGVLKENSANQNYFEWRPFLGDMQTSDAYTSNVQIFVHLPWGSSERSHSAYADSLSTGEGYQISSNKDFSSTWTESTATLYFSMPCYAYDFDGDYKLEVSLEKQGRMCGRMPLWLYFVIAVAGLIGILCACSLLGYLFFEKPYSTVRYSTTTKYIQTAHEDQDFEQFRMLPSPVDRLGNIEMLVTEDTEAEPVAFYH